MPSYVKPGCVFFGRSRVAFSARVGLSRVVVLLGLSSMPVIAGCTKDKPIAQISGRVGVTVSADGFNPSSMAVAKGVPLTLEFRRVSDQTCATKVVFPDLKIEKDLPLNEIVAIEVPTHEARTWVFQCGMGMYKSRVVVQ